MVKALTFFGTAGLWFLGITLWTNYSRNSVTAIALTPVVRRLVAPVGLPPRRAHTHTAPRANPRSRSDETRLIMGSG
jgi:hypothetical protein